MRRHLRRRGMLGLVVLSLVAGAPGSSTRGAEQPPSQTVKVGSARTGAVTVTPVEGPSTLHHLGLSIEHSSMGWSGQWGSPPSNLQSPLVRFSHAEDPDGRFVLSGADLYRISCRACHKEDGSGGPPEINSIIGPVQAASVQWMTKRMKEMGRTVSPAFIRDLVAANDADLRKRLKVGGHNMPSFAHLSDEEINVLRPYFDELASVPGAGRQERHITEPAARVGELIVKGTCHICHDATGPDDKPTTVLSDVIPSLASISRQKTANQFIQKIRAGAPILLSAGGVLSRGRMPIFNYLTNAEAASTYAYLIAYPPK